MDGEWDKDVLGAVANGGRSGTSVAEILNSVDAWQKVALSLEELNASLSRLVAAGLVVPIGEHYRLAEAEDRGLAEFEPVTEEAFGSATSGNWKQMIDVLRTMDDQYSDPEAPAWPKLDGKWAFEDEHYASDLEVAGLGTVVERLTQSLVANGFIAEPGAFSSGPGYLEFSISGRKTDKADDMLRVALPIFLAAATPGSELEVREWDPTGVGPSSAEVADRMERMLRGEAPPEEI